MRFAGPLFDAEVRVLLPLGVLKISALRGSATSRPLAVLCVGTDAYLLESRRLLLQSAGFDTTCALPREAPEILFKSTFDILIISVNVNEEDRVAIATSVSKRTRVIQLTGFTAPGELLALLR